MAHAQRRVKKETVPIHRKCSEGDGFALNIADQFSIAQIDDLVQLCNTKIEEHELRYGRKSIWHSKFAGAKDISGPLQYEVLKRAKERCELCGISKSITALQVDHIVLRSKDGFPSPAHYRTPCLL